MLKIREAIAVEGRYDKNTLSQVVDTLILETHGFGIFKDPERMALLRRAAEKPLTGHHAGVYGQWVTYDFETGGCGQMGGEPGGDIWDRASFGVGLEYGYALPIGRRLNLDFVAGLGYLGGTYYEYEPEDDCYVWQATKKRRYVGPTKLEVTLMWLVGRGNVNKGKGGKR